MLDANMIVLEPERQFLECIASYMSLYALYGLTRQLLSSVFTFLGEEWNNLLLLGGFRTL